MDSKFKYHRSFFIFDEEDNGFGTDQKPSGHVRIEIKEGRGKLFCQVSNLSENNGKIQFQLFLIKADEQEVVPVLAGNIELKRNRGDFEWAFDPYNVGNTNLPFDKFNVIAVLADYTDRKNNYIICPLVAYKNGKVKWRQEFNKVLLQEKANDNMLNQIKENDDIANKVSNENIFSDENIESINKKQQAVENEKQEATENQQSEAINEEIISQENNSKAKQKLDELLKIKTELENESKPDTKKPVESLEKNKVKPESKPEEEELTKEEPVKKEIVEEENIKDKIEKEAMEDNVPQDNPAQDNAAQEKPVKEKKISPKGKSYSSYNGSKVFDMDTDDDNYNMNLNTNCINCIFVNNKNAPKPQIKEFTSEELTKQFDSVFKRYSPFSVKRTDYIWWKVASPVHLNNILYNYGIRIPVLFNPLVLMAHYKYNHLIVGIYQDDIRQRDYIVCGIPGIYWVDEKPFANACRWAQVEGNMPTYGAFGYWIVYINPKTGKILAIGE